MPAFRPLLDGQDLRLGQALSLLEQRLAAWAADGEAFAVVSRRAFGLDSGDPAAQALRDTLLGEGLGVDLVVRSLPGLRGAYAAATDDRPEVVLLDRDWLPTASLEELEGVLMEEIGHAIDQRLHGASDTPGDEGEIFSALLRGLPPSPGSALENDQRWLTLEGLPRLVEASDTLSPTVLFNGANAPSFTGSSIGFGLPVAGTKTRPSFVDIDGDGDLDAFIGQHDGTTLLFRNTGTATSPAFAASSTGFGLTDVGDLASPTFADIDGDGDPDAFVGNSEGWTFFFRNTGTATSPAFAASSIGFGFPDVGYLASPALADIDGDGDVDVFIGGIDGTTLFFRNTGTATSPAFAGSSIGFGLPSTASFASPTLADCDADGDLDLFIGNEAGQILFFRNTGTATNPAFAGSSLGFGLPDVGTAATPTLADIDGDADLDLFTGNLAGQTLFFRNSAGGLSSPNLNAAYGVGQSIIVNVPFSEVVSVDTTAGSPLLMLTTDSGDRAAYWLGGDNSTTLRFLYVVQAGDATADLDIASTDALRLNGATIRDAAGNDADLTLPAPGSPGSLAFHADLVLDTVSPALAMTGVTSTTPPATYGMGSSITIQVPFNKVVFVDKTDGTPSLILETGSGDREAVYDLGSGTDTLQFIYSVQPGDVSLSLDYASQDALRLNGGRVYDVFGTDALLTLPTPGSAGSLSLNTDLAVDGVAPTLIASTPVDDATGVSEVGLLQLTFSEDVQPGTGAIQLRLQDGTLVESFVGSEGSAGGYVSYSGPTIRVVPATDFASNTDYSITIAWNALTDRVGNRFNGFTDPTVLNFRTGDTRAPIVLSVSSLSANGTFVPGNTIQLAVRFSEPVLVNTSGGVPGLLLETGVTDRTATLLSGSGSDTLIFAYAVQSGDSSMDLSTASSEALTLNGATIRDAAGNAADLTLPAPDGEGALAVQADVLIDGVAPAVAPRGTNTIAFSGSSQAFGLESAVVLPRPTFVDIDADGDLDAFIGNVEGNTLFHRNTGTPTSAAFAEGSSSPFNLSSVGNNSSPWFADIDADGDLDAFIGNGSGKIVFFRNTGTASLAAFADSSIGFGLPEIGSMTTPSFSDIDADGDLDLYVVNGEAHLLFYRNTGSATAAAFSASSSSGLPANLFPRSVQFADIDGDSDLDAVIGGSDGQVFFFRNTGTPGSPVFSQESTGLGVPPNVSLASCALADIDADADLDLFQAEFEGTVRFFRNTSTGGLFSPNANGSQNAGSLITIQVPFTEDVIVDTTGGTPTLWLETGGTDREAVYVSGSGTNALRFHYTVQSGDSSADLDVVSTTSLRLNGGSIRDGAGNNATLTLPAPGGIGSLGANAALVIDGVNPTVTALSSTTANGSWALGSAIAIRVNWSEVVSVNTSGGLPTLRLETGGTNRTAQYVGGSGNSLDFSYWVQSGDWSSDLDVLSTTALQLNGATLRDAAGNEAILTLPTPGAPGSLGANAALTVDGVVPTVAFTGLTSATPDGGYAAGSVLTLQVPFTENVVVDTSGGIPTLRLETGGIDRLASYVSGSGTNLLSFRYTVQAGDVSADLDVVSSTALELNGATIRDAAGNNANLTLAAPGAYGSLGANAALVIDARAPQVSSLTSSTANGTYSVGSAITIQVRFSEPVTLNTSGGSPTLLMETGSTDRQATYISGSGSNTLSFRYTVQSGDRSDDLDVQSANALQLNGATLRDAVGNTAQLTLPAPGTAGSLSANAALVINSEGPTVSLNGGRSPSFSGSSIGFGLPDVSYIAKPTFGDIDNDGDLDAFISNNEGSTFFFRNTGSATNPAFAGSSLGFGLPTIGLQASPALVDIDADGDLDLFIGEQAGTTLFFRNTGTRSNPAFAGSSVGFGLPSVTSFTAPTFADIDGDGDFDAFIGNYTGNTYFFRNTGSATNAAFASSSIAFGLADVGFSAAPTFADIDGDGDLDAFIGNFHGNTIFFRNTGSRTQPSFAGSSIGFGIPNIGQYSSPSLADIDGDGDLDLFLGELNGNTLFFRNTASGGVSSSTPNGTYGVGTVITILVPFTEAVTVNTSGGTPTLLLETGTVDRTAVYSGGSGTTTLQFRYTVQAGDISSDLDVASTAALQLNGATIRNAQGLNAILTLPAPGTTGSLSATSALVIQTSAPTLLSSTPADNATAVSETANLVLTFSKPVQARSGGGGPIILFRMNDEFVEIFDTASGLGSEGGRLTISGSTVTLNPLADLASNTSYYLTVSNTALVDSNGNPFAGFQSRTALNFTTGDSLAPGVSALTSLTPNSTLSAGALISVAVHFSEAVTVDTTNGVPILLLETGPTDRIATYQSGSGTDTLTFTAVVQTGDTSPDLDVVSTSALQLNGATIRDAAGNNARLTVPAPGGAGSLGAAADLVIDSFGGQDLVLINGTPSVTEGSSMSVTLMSSSLAPGSTLYWSLSGTSISASDFSPAALTGTLVLGSDRRAVFTRPVALDGVQESTEVATLAFFSDSARTASLAGTQITLKDLTPTGPAGATDDRDLIIGTGGTDTISGVPSGSVLNGRGSWDTLTGNGGNDLFLLGTSSAVYYDDGVSSLGGTNDLATITDFNAGDRIQLKGSAADYRLTGATLSGLSGTLVYWRSTAGAGSVNEAIGFVQNQTTSTLSLSNTSQFLYV